MKVKHCKRWLLAGALPLAFIIVSGYGGDSSSKPEPNRFQEENTTINTEEIQADLTNNYKKIPAQVRQLTFKKTQRDEQLLNKLFLEPGEREKINVERETAKLGLFE
ncbi:type VII secretion EssA family protein [Sporolactobacillus sp. Y61]|jgi:hypothetical protein|uniref:Type VII secretion EssA family protein n=1 Tax=Sporolactobacillus sp. Y61 TaxID=3160863 RepID=A0AAU8IIK0_9BACL|nr:type VII secretion EssA family protein [Sporolactobacillus sp. THM19-2]RYL89248.1 hypothetical protein EWH91_10825 [Sporolactobacillus sp. THM19-2]